jgi:hypothetical protein
MLGLYLLKLKNKNIFGKLGNTTFKSVPKQPIGIIGLILVFHHSKKFINNDNDFYRDLITLLKFDIKF